LGDGWIFWEYSGNSVLDKAMAWAAGRLPFLKEEISFTLPFCYETKFLTFKNRYNSQATTAIKAPIM
jgi:hypothetical protein